MHFRIPTFIIASHLVQILPAAFVRSDQIGEDPHRHMWMVVMFDHVGKGVTGSIGDQHDGLIALATLGALIVLERQLKKITIIITENFLTIDVTHPSKQLKGRLQGSREVGRIFTFYRLDCSFYLFDVVGSCTNL